MNKEEFARKANERSKRAREFLAPWRTQARDDFAFISGAQWLSDDENKLEAEGRVAVTFNYSEKMVDAVSGAEVSGRQETNYAPRGLEDAGLSDLWNAAAKYVRQNCNAEDEESDAFRDAIICGLGWTWTHMDYERDLDGEILIERIDPLEMTYDPAARKVGLSDRRFQDREWWIDESDAKKQWKDAIWPNDTTDGNQTDVIVRGNRYEQGVAPEDDSNMHKGQVKIRMHECYEFEPVYRIQGADGALQEFSEQDFNKLLAQNGPLPEGSYVRQRKRVYYRAFFAGETLLEVRKSPCQDGFCINPITGKRDRNKNTWYGITKVMKDPQRWANKWLSQILDIINKNSKGGLLAEIGAFVDPNKAADTWSAADGIVFLNQGGIDKVKEKGMAQYPNGLDKLMGFALNSLPMVTGINLEALGLANREQAGVLEQQRKQAAYGLLAPLFDALRRYRKDQGRVLLSYITNYISDGRLIRIGGPESEQFLPLTKQDKAPRYDIIVDQSPNSPDARAKTWETLTNILPQMMKAGVPIPPDVVDYVPIPATLATKWKEFIGQQQQANQQMQEEMGKLQKENESLKSGLQLKQQQMEMDMQAEQARLQMEREKMQNDIQLARDKAQAEFELKMEMQDREFELQRRQMEHDRQMKQASADNEFRIKAFTSGVDPDEAGKFSVDLQTGQLDSMLGQFAQMSAQIMEQAQESSRQTAQALQGLIDVMSRDRVLTFDQTGRPVGSKLQ